MGGTAFTVGHSGVERGGDPRAEHRAPARTSSTGSGREYEVIIGSNGSTDSTTALGVDLIAPLPARHRSSTCRRRASGSRSASSSGARSIRSWCPSTWTCRSTIGFVATARRAARDPRHRRRLEEDGQPEPRTLFRRLGSDSFLRATRLLLGLDLRRLLDRGEGVPACDALRRFIDRVNEGSSYVPRDLLPDEAPTGGRIDAGAGDVRGLARARSSTCGTRPSTSTRTSCGCGCGSSGGDATEPAGAGQ